MRDNYDFSNSILNPYAEKLKKQIALCLDEGEIPGRARECTASCLALIKRIKVAKLKSFKGKVNLNLDIDSLRKRNARFD